MSLKYFRESSTTCYFSELESKALSRYSIFSFHSGLQVSSTQKKWNISATLAIQVSKSSALCCSHESTLMTSNAASRESIVCAPAHLPTWPAHLPTRPAAGSRGTLKAVDSHEVVLAVIRLLSWEQHNVLLFRTWIECVGLKLWIWVQTYRWEKYDSGICLFLL